MSPSDPPEPSSPSCFAHEADDSYMGYASRTQIVAFLNEIRACAPKTPAARAVLIHRIRQMLPKVRDDDTYREVADLVRHLEDGNIA
jgi:hypothetical protein